MTTNTVFTTQTVLCEAPYCLALLYYIHVQQERSLPLQWSKQLVEVLSVSLVHTTSATQFRLHHLQMKLWKYVRWWFHWYNYSNTAEFTSIIILTYIVSLAVVLFMVARTTIECSHEWKTCWLRWEGGVIIKQALEDSTAALEIQQRDATVVHPTTVPSATVQSLQRYPFLSV